MEQSDPNLDPRDRVRDAGARMGVHQQQTATSGPKMVGAIQVINWVCYTICIVCIVAGVLLGLTMIWGDRTDPNQWRFFLSLIVLFTGSALTLSVNRVLRR